jgi:hypothetical protein
MELEDIKKIRQKDFNHPPKTPEASMGDEGVLRQYIEIISILCK